MKKETFADKVEKALKEQGRSKKWLAETLEMSHPTLTSRFKKNSFKVCERPLLCNILSIVED